MSNDETREACRCACHVSSGTHRARCTIDTGSSGVVGVPSCSPCAGPPAVALEDACMLGHPEPVERFVGYACRRHYHWIDRTLKEIEELFALMDDVILPGPASGGERHGTRDGSPAPGRVEVMALTDKRAFDWEPGSDDVPDVVGSLAGWAALVEESNTSAVLRPSRRVTAAPRCPLRPDPTLTLTLTQRRTCEHESCASALPLDPPTLTEIIRFLRRWRQWIVQRPWLDDYADDLAALHRHVARGVGDTMWPKPIGSCPNCQVPLYNTIGVDEVTCRKCRATWAGAALARLRLIHEQEAS